MNIILRKYLHLIIITVILGVLVSCGEPSEIAGQAETEVPETALTQSIPQRPEPQAKKEPDTVENFTYYLDKRIPEDIREIVLDNRRHTFINIDMDIEEHPEKYLTLDYDEEIDKSIVKILEEADNIPPPPSYIPLETVEKELDFLMDYLKYYYGAYAYYGGDETFHAIKENIISELKDKGKDAVTASEYTYILARDLSENITDCHFVVGNKFFGNTQEHRYFLRSTEHFFYGEDGAFYAEIESKIYELISVNGLTPSEMTVPYLNEDGLVTWIIGYPSTTNLKRQISIELYNESAQELIEKEIILSPSDSFVPDTKPLYNEYEIEGIQIAESRRCRPLASEENMDILMAESAEKLRDKNLIVVDLRGNGGGSSIYPKTWVSSLLNADINTTHGVFSSRRTRTVHYIQPYDTVITAEDFIAESEDYPGWYGPSYFAAGPNKNRDRLLIVLMDSSTGSAGEDFADYLRQTENTIIIGTNSAGAFAIGDVNYLTLPYSKVNLRCGFNLHLEPDLTTIEGMGIMPDIWAESNDALDRTLKFIKNYGLAE